MLRAVCLASHQNISLPLTVSFDFVRFYCTDVPKAGPLVDDDDRRFLVTYVIDLIFGRWFVCRSFIHSDNNHHRHRHRHATYSSMMKMALFFLEQAVATCACSSRLHEWPFITSRRSLFSILKSHVN